MIEDLTTYEEVPARRWSLNTDLINEEPIINMIVERREIVPRERTLMTDDDTVEAFAESITEPLRTHPYLYHNGRLLAVDRMKRDIRPGDIITWRSGGWYHRHQSFGLVLGVLEDPRCIKVRNQNDNKVTIWNTFDVIILARMEDYSLIPDEFLQMWGIENF